uniref:Uncharacterized protein n=1 Tax=Globisporangium ultimum (strain ATCC 200006 / CBS 805.95 / DAOM BR144) TaxID=431595 RepID=K3X3Q2_GLOUD
MTPTVSSEKRLNLGRLDAQAEYLDEDGVPRRSKKVTRRMLQRGYSISKAAFLSETDQRHTCRELWEKEEKERSEKFRLGLAELSTKEKANETFKKMLREKRREQIDERNEFIATRLDLWYDGSFVSKEDANVDITEESKQLSPSKLQRFLDSSGNLRCKSNDTTSATQAELAMQVPPPENADVPGVVTKDDEMPHASDEKQKQNEVQDPAPLLEMTEHEKKQAANGAFKMQNKAARHQWIQKSNEMIAARLDLWYDNKYVPKDDDNVDITEANTPESPSKLQRFIDMGGNLRRKANALSGNADAYVAVATPPVSPEKPK